MQNIVGQSLVNSHAWQILCIHIILVSSPDRAPLATQGNGLATIEVFLVEGAEHYQDLDNDQSDRSIPHFRMIVM